MIKLPNIEVLKGLPADALPVPDAARQLVPAELWEHYLSTIKDRAALPRRIVRYSTWMHGDDAIAGNEAADKAAAAHVAKDQAWAAIKGAFHAKLLEGSLSAYVRRDFPFGRWQPVPADAWRTLRITDWRKGIAQAPGVRLADLRISSVCHTDEQPATERQPEPTRGPDAHPPAAEPPALEPEVAEPVRNHEREALRLTIDEDKKRIVIAGVGELAGADYRLVAALAETAQQDVQALRAPEDHRYVEARKLSKKLNMDDESVYRRVSKCRRAFSAMAQAAFGHPVDQQALIENSKGEGFRLNPQIRFVAPKDE